jgi:hypothetical protein
MRKLNKYLDPLGYLQSYRQLKKRENFNWSQMNNSHVELTNSPIVLSHWFSRNYVSTSAKANQVCTDTEREAQKNKI